MREQLRLRCIPAQTSGVAASRGLTRWLMPPRTGGGSMHASAVCATDLGLGSCRGFALLERKPSRSVRTHVHAEQYQTQRVEQLSSRPPVVLQHAGPRARGAAARECTFDRRVQSTPVPCPISKQHGSPLLSSFVSPSELRLASRLSARKLRSCDIWAVVPCPSLKLQCPCFCSGRRCSLRLSMSSRKQPLRQLSQRSDAGRALTCVDVQVGVRSGGMPCCAALRRTQSSSTRFS